MFVKVALDDQVSNKVGGITKAIGGGIATAAAVGAAAVGAATTAVASLAKASVSAFGDFEQLAGGVATLFGDEGMGTVFANAEKAFKTAGLSANEYMETVTSFSASLLQSVGGDTAKAANIADMAITDMSDNANKMGTSMEAIQNAYNGFAKQNYTMLDNLKLGYGGTKQEMERLLKDAQKLSGVKYDISNLSDVYEAIHVVQTELGITGTTALEASTTIQGSLAMTKSAWQNVLTAMAGGTEEFEMNFDSALTSLVESAGTFFDNVKPRVLKAVEGIGQVITKLAPKIGEMFPQMLSELLPALVTSVTSLIEGASGAIPTILEAITNSLPLMIDAGMQLILALVDGLIQNAPQILTALMIALATVVESLFTYADQFGQAAQEWMTRMIDKMSERIGEFITTATEIVNSIIEGIKQKVEDLAAQGRELVTTIKNAVTEKVSDMLDAGFRLVQGLWQGISNNLGWIKGKITGWVGDVTSFLKGLFGIASPSKVTAEMGMWLVKGLAKGITDNTDIVNSAWEKMSSGITDVSADYTASENNVQGRNGAINIVQNIQAVAQTPVDLANATAAYFEQARWAMA